MHLQADRLRSPRPWLLVLAAAVLALPAAAGDGPAVQATGGIHAGHADPASDLAEPGQAGEPGPSGPQPEAQHAKAPASPSHVADPGLELNFEEIKREEGPGLPAAGARAAGTPRSARPRPAELGVRLNYEEIEWKQGPPAGAPHPITTPSHLPAPGEGGRGPVRAGGAGPPAPAGPGR